MKNGVGVSQNIVLFGGTSEIGQAILRRVVKPGVSRLVLVSRDIDAANRVSQELVGAHPELDVHHVRYEASDATSMEHVVAEVADSIGDIDIAIVAQGLLNEGADYYANPADLVEMVNVNFTGEMVLLYAVAGERVRRGNPVYGATKAGLDGFALALDHELEGSGASLLVVRPGFVTTKMTTGMKKAPLSTNPETVAQIVEKGIASDKKIVWAPAPLHWMFLILKNLPIAIWRRLPI
jgi:decaprenylphospho-beta-D-erythro-pentofuranosid-2-ulose 2-reductase